MSCRWRHGRSNETISETALVTLSDPRLCIYSYFSYSAPECLWWKCGVWSCLWVNSVFWVKAGLVSFVKQQSQQNCEERIWGGLIWICFILLPQLWTQTQAAILGNTQSSQWSRRFVCLVIHSSEHRRLLPSNVLTAPPFLFTVCCHK